MCAHIAEASKSPWITSNNWVMPFHNNLPLLWSEYRRRRGVDMLDDMTVCRIMEVIAGELYGKDYLDTSHSEYLFMLFSYATMATLLSIEVPPRWHTMNYDIKYLKDRFPDSTFNVLRDLLNLEEER